VMDVATALQSMREGHGWVVCNELTHSSRWRGAKSARNRLERGVKHEKSGWREPKSPRHTDKYSEFDLFHVFVSA
jgi:hypothetical protein